MADFLDNFRKGSAAGQNYALPQSPAPNFLGLPLTGTTHQWIDEITPIIYMSDNAAVSSTFSQVINYVVITDMWLQGVSLSASNNTVKIYLSVQNLQIGTPQAPVAVNGAIAMTWDSPYYFKITAGQSIVIYAVDNINMNSTIQLFVQGFTIPPNKQI
jgi:hypothetical protein